MLPPSIENNLFLVRRLIQRTDMRNPDPSPRRYTSLAWAAVLGHEETFEFLLGEGHDDEELSRVHALNLLRDEANLTALRLSLGLREQHHPYATGRLPTASAEPVYEPIRKFRGPYWRCTPDGPTIL